MPPEERARAKELWYKVKELKLDPYLKERIYETFDQDLPVEEKECAIVRHAYGNYVYKAVNLGHNQYKIFSSQRIDPKTKTASWLDEILKEVVGDNWEDYDED